MDRDQAMKALMGLNLVIGIAFLLFPKLSMRLYGIDPERNTSAAYPLRYVGARSLLLAALFADRDGQSLLMKQLPLIAAVDGTANGIALVTGEVPRKAAVLGALTSAAAVAIGFTARD